MLVFSHDKIEYRSSHKIEMTITFYSDVWLSPVIYRDARNLKPKLVANSNNNNISLGSWATIKEKK